MAAASLATTVAKKLQGKVAVITGGASGIGEATAKLFVRYGAKVVVADIQDDRGQALCKELASSGDISYAHCDVTKESEVKDAVDYAVSEHGKLDIMFNNAGVTPSILKPSVFDAEKSQFDRVFDVNVCGSFYGAKHAARVMIPNKSGSIIFTGSTCTVTGPGTPLPYTCSKYALVGLTNQLCVELGQHGIRANCISPFFVHTPIIDNALGAPLDPEMPAKWLSAAANLKEVATGVEDTAEAAAFFGSDESKYISGINLVLDGGYSRTNPLMAMAMAGKIS